MKKGIASIRRTGFTLIEVLVTVVVIGVLAAVVIPAVTAQVSAGDSSRVSNDLNNLRTGIENFDIAVRQFPGDVDDLVNRPGTGISSTGANVDADADSVTYTATTLWAGPYVEATVPAGASSSTWPNARVVAMNTGYAATINNKLWDCNINSTAAGCTTTSPNYVAIEVNNLSAAQAAILETLLDAAGGTPTSTTGKWRFLSDAVSSTGWYFATPTR